MELRSAVVAYGQMRGWYLIWPDGFESAMPSKEAAYQCAAALKLLVLAKQAEAIIENVPGFQKWLSGAREAIAAAEK